MNSVFSIQRTIYLRTYAVLSTAELRTLPPCPGRRMVLGAHGWAVPHCQDHTADVADLAARVDVWTFSVAF